jgi:minor histocompatibility antigen H13
LELLIQASPSLDSETSCCQGTSAFHLHLERPSQYSHRVFIALALRFDYHLALKRIPLLTPSTSFAKPYFLSCFASYIAGLATTIFVMHTFKSAQPALLYLSPACVGSVVLCALIRGESKEFWAFDDGSEDEERQEKKVKEIEEAPVKEEVVASSTPTSTRTLRSRTSRLAVE